MFAPWPTTWAGTWDVAPDLTELRRTVSGPFRLADALTVEQLEALVAAGQLSSHLLVALGHAGSPDPYCAGTGRRQTGAVTGRCRTVAGRPGLAERGVLLPDWRTMGPCWQWPGSSKGSWCCNGVFVT